MTVPRKPTKRSHFHWLVISVTFRQWDSEPKTGSEKRRRSASGISGRSTETGANWWRNSSRSLKALVRTPTSPVGAVSRTLEALKKKCSNALIPFSRRGLTPERHSRRHNRDLFVCEREFPRKEAEISCRRRVSRASCRRLDVSASRYGKTVPIAVGMLIAEHPPHRSQRACFTHWCQIGH